jgi:trans-aconitate methyltransferase
MTQHSEAVIMEQVQSIYEWDAKAYHRLSDPQYEIAMELLGQVEIRDDETVVVAGCGSGRVTVELLRRLPRGHLIAVDRSRNMIDMAREVLEKDAERIVFVEADLQTFCLPQAVDGIFSSSALHFVADHGRMFVNFAKTLRPGGWLAVQFGMVDPSAKMPWLDVVREVFAKPAYQGLGIDPSGLFPRFFPTTEAATRDELNAAGFVDINVVPRQVVMEFPKGSSDNWTDMMLRQPLARVADAEQRLRIAEDVTQALSKAGGPDWTKGQSFEFLACRAKMPTLS